MRCMVRNKVVFYYALYEGQTEITDEYGNVTGQYSVTHGNPIAIRGNVSAAQGEIMIQQFGEGESYDKVIVLDDKNAPIDEHSILWVDTPPLLNEDGSTRSPHDYIVTKVATSLNVKSIAIRKVTVR